MKPVKKTKTAFYIASVNVVFSIFIVALSLTSESHSLWYQLSIVALGLVIILLSAYQYFSIVTSMPKNITIETQEQSDSKSQLQNPSANVSAKTFDSASISAIIPDTYVNMEDFCNKFLSKLANQLQLVQAVMYVKNARDEFNFCGSYAFYSTIKPLPFKAGEGINGQVARNKKPLQIKNIPNNYATIISGLGEGNPQNVIIIPIIKDNTTIGLLEIASFINLNYDFNDISEKLSDTIGEILFNLLGK